MTPFDAVDLGREYNFDDVDVKTEVGPMGQTLLQAAIGSTTSPKYRSTDWLEFFVSHGVPLDHHDVNGDTALHYSISRGFNDITMFLISKKANVNASNKHGNGPLWAAIINGKTAHEVISALVAAGADTKQVNKHGRSCGDLVKEMNLEWLKAATNVR